MFAAPSTCRRFCLLLHARRRTVIIMAFGNIALFREQRNCLIPTAALTASCQQCGDIPNLHVLVRRFRVMSTLELMLLSPTACRLTDSSGYWLLSLLTSYVLTSTGTSRPSSERGLLDGVSHGNSDLNTPLVSVESRQQNYICTCPVARK